MSDTCDTSHLPASFPLEECVMSVCDGRPLLLQGPPGVGQTMLARRLPGIIPTVRDTGDFRELAAIYALAALDASLSAGDDGSLRMVTNCVTRPFRAPHYTVSGPGLRGTHRPGHLPRPGEASLAHRGVLFLDDLHEFGMGALMELAEALKGRGPLPARPVVVVATAPTCPCGWRGYEWRERKCTCSAQLQKAYDARLQKTLATLASDWRFVEMGPAGFEAMQAMRDGRPLDMHAPSETWRDKVAASPAWHARVRAAKGNVP